MDTVQQSDAAAPARAEVSRRGFSAGVPIGAILSLTSRAPALGVGLVMGVAFCATALASIGVAWPITHPEGATIAGILRVRDGEPLYLDYRQFPYITTAYPPLIYVATGLVSRALGASAMETIVLARGLSFLSSLAVVGLIYGLARAQGANRSAALAGAGLFLPLPFLQDWGFAARPDLPAVALSLAAALLLVRSPRRAWPAAVVAVAASFGKQTAIALPVAAVLWLWLDGGRRQAVVFGMVWLGLTLGCLGLLHLATEGRYELNVIFGQMVPVNDVAIAWREFVRLPAAGWLPAILAVGAVVFELLRRRRPGLMSLYGTVALAVALYTLRGRGSSDNYLIEASAVICVLAAAAIDRLWRLLDAGSPIGMAGAVALAVAAVVWAAPRWDDWRETGGVDPAGRLPVEEIAAADRVLSEEPLAVVLAGKPLAIADSFHLSMLTTAGRFDPNDLVRRIKRTEFDLIVLRGDVQGRRSEKQQPLWPEEARIAIKDHYARAGRVGQYWLYKPGD